MFTLLIRWKQQMILQPINSQHEWLGKRSYLQQDLFPSLKKLHDKDRHDYYRHLKREKSLKNIKNEEVWQLFRTFAKRPESFNAFNFWTLGSPVTSLNDAISPPIKELCVSPHLWIVPREIKFWKIEKTKFPTFSENLIRQAPIRWSSILSIIWHIYNFPLK